MKTTVEQYEKWFIETQRSPRDGDMKIARREMDDLLADFVLVRTENKILREAIGRIGMQLEAGMASPNGADFEAIRKLVVQTADDLEFVAAKEAARAPRS